MAVELEPKNILRLGTGNGTYLYIGNGAFVTTGATVELQTPFTSIDAVILTPIGAYAAADQLSVNETVTDGKIGHTDGAVTVTRDAAGTSGLAFSYIVRGY
jgi:hypothetical protein